MTCNKIIMLITIILLIACKKNTFKVSDEITETINLTHGLSNKGDRIKLSEFADAIQYIFLETTDECLISEIEKIMLDDSLVFIFNRRQFFIFDITGKYLRSIGRVGKGPGEFLRIMDFTINTNDNIIYIYDSDQRKVIGYNYNGDLAFEFRLDSNPTRITSVNNEFLILSWVKPDFIGNENYGFSFYSMDGKQIKKTFNRKNEKAKSTMPSTHLTRLNYYCDSLTYWEINLNTIYRITENGKMIPRYNIFYENNKPLRDVSLKQDFFYFSYFIETEKNLFFLRGVYNNEIKHLIYNKKTRDIQSINFNHKEIKNNIKYGFLNDIDGGYPFLPFDALKDGRLYCTFYPHELKILIAQKIYDQIEIKDIYKQQQLYKSISKSKTMDNPVIMLLKIN